MNIVQKKNNIRSESSLILKIFISLFPVQAITVGLPAINGLITGALIGSFLGDEALAAQGFAIPVTIVIKVLLIFNVGSQILCGQLLGRGDENEIKRTFSTGLTFSVIAGAALTLILLFFSGPLATLLGARDAMVPLTAEYLRGYSISVIPTMLTTCLLTALQLDCEKARPVAVIILNMVLNIAANLANIFIFHKGIYGVGIANAFAYTASFLLCLPHFIRKTKVFRYSLSGVSFGILKQIAVLGVPNATLALCDTLRGGVLNNVISYFYGPIGMAAMAVAGNVNQSIADPIQAGDIGASGIVASILFGERDIDSLRKLPKTVAKAVIPISVAAYALIFFLAGPIAGVFGADPENMNLYILCIRLLPTWLLADFLISPSIAIYQSMGKTGMSNALNILNNFGFQLVIFIASVIFNVPWISICTATIGCIMTYLFLTAYYVIRQKRLPKSPLEVTYISSDFSVPATDRLALTVRNLQDSMAASIETIRFCIDKEFSRTASNMAGLCVEEVTTNRLLHSKVKDDDEEHSIDIRIIYEKNGLEIMIRDNFPGFNPAKWLENFHSDDSFRALGIRTVMKAAKRVDYTSVLNLSILSIKIEKT